jgi:phenylacetate-CoA ligase
MTIQRPEPRWCTELLAHCSGNVIRYHGIRPQLAAFPIIEKREIVDDYSVFIAGNLGADREALTALLHDEGRRRASISEGTRWKNLFIEETSGTSGIPFNFPKLVSERAMAAFEIWNWRRKIDPQATHAAFYPFLHAPLGFKHEYPPSDLSEENIRKLYEHLSSKCVRWVHGPPELLRQHATILRKLAPADLTVRFFECSGLFVSTEAKTEIESLPITLVNQYGCREAWVIGYGVNSTNEFEVLTENVHVELVDEAGASIDQAQVAGDILVTARFPRLMPFVRYRTGDRGMWMPGAVGNWFSLINGEREPGAKRWGKWGSGSRFFRIMLARTYMETGYIALRYLQIREIGKAIFLVTTDDIPRRSELCCALERVCEVNAPRGDSKFVFSSKIMADDDLERELRAKPRLFIPSPSAQNLEAESYF